MDRTQIEVHYVNPLSSQPLRHLTLGQMIELLDTQVYQGLIVGDELLSRAMKAYTKNSDSTNPELMKEVSDLFDGATAYLHEAFNGGACYGKFSDKVTMHVVRAYNTALRLAYLTAGRRDDLEGKDNLAQFWYSQADSLKDGIIKNWRTRIETLTKKKLEDNFRLFTDAVHREYKQVRPTPISEEQKWWKRKAA